MGKVLAPLILPLKRRLQTFSVVCFLGALPFCLLLGALWPALSLYCMYGSETDVWVNGCGTMTLGLFGIYLIYIFCIDTSYIYDGGKSKWFLRSALFCSISKNFVEFYPHEVVFDPLVLEQNNATLDNTEVAGGRYEPGGRYLHCCHPHGLFGLGVWCTFVANYDGGAAASFFHHHVFGGNNNKELPDVEVAVHTMTANFRIPFWREFLLALGFRDVGRRSLVHSMTRAKGGDRRIHFSVLVPGGASEAVDCTTPVLTLKRRKGFVRIALETGCSLVPVFSFGETRLYKPLVQLSRVHSVLRRVQKVLGVGTPLVRGRGVFNYAFGLLPFRERLITVIGRPIRVLRSSEAAVITEAAIDAVHEQYIAAIQDLYRRYQPIYDSHSTHRELVIS